MADHYTVYVTPSSPTYYQYTFGNDVQKSATLFVKSDEQFCAHVSIQRAEVRP